MSTITKIDCGFIGLLTLIFVAAKLWNQIDWSWWWVFSPMWISALVILGVCLIAIMVVIVIAIIDAIWG